MIICFSASGNTRFVADFLAEKLGDEVISLNAIMHNKETGLEFSSEKPFIIMAPIYAWDLPKPVLDIVEGAAFTGSKQAYFVATMGEDCGRADETCVALAQKKGLEYMGFTGIKMPDSTITLFDMPTAEEAAEIIKASIPAMQVVADAVAAGETIVRTDKSNYSSEEAAAINQMFNENMNKNDFTVSEKCLKCRTCIVECPRANVSLVDGKITFGENCMSCYRCIHACQLGGIDIKGKTEGKRRYIAPAYRNWKL